jgi:short-subunit dehydrogenase
MKKAIVIGATSGIGRALAKILSENNYEVGITGRRLEKLQSLQKELTNKCYIKNFDISCGLKAMNLLQELIDEMKDVDLIIINSGIGYDNFDLDWQKEKEMIEINVAGFVSMANIAYKYFLKRKTGHLVGISSIAAIRGGDAICYGASKAFVSNYLQGLQKKEFKSNIFITEIQPGFVDTEMTKGQTEMFWVSSSEKAAEQIYQAIQKNKKHAYITRRWRIIVWLLKILPDFIINKI